MADTKYMKTATAKVRRHNVKQTEGIIMHMFHYKVCVSRAVVNEVDVCRDSAQLSTCSLQGQQFLLP